MGHMMHLAMVEVDPKTGKVAILDYVAVHDCGTMVTPLMLAGHVRSSGAGGCSKPASAPSPQCARGPGVTGDRLCVQPIQAELPAVCSGFDCSA
jgi:Molybdopterin-binding domain of aldehyde dehydrogenase